jgi:undecaprenyl-diphosphatase
MQKARDLIKNRFHTAQWYGFNLTMALISLFLALYFFGVIVDDLVDEETLFYLDFRVQSFIEGIITPELTQFMVKITNLGGLYFTLIISALIVIYFLYKREWWDILTLVLVVVGGKILQILLKIFFLRPRPTSPIVAAHGYSFPSGHALTAMLVYGFLIYITWKSNSKKSFKMLIFLVSLFLILIIGISRIYLNVHWLTDILGGYAAGFSWLVISIIMVKTVRHLKGRESET